MDLSWNSDVDNGGHEHTIQSGRSGDAIFVAAVSTGLATGCGFTMGMAIRVSGEQQVFRLENRHEAPPPHP